MEITESTDTITNNSSDPIVFVDKGQIEKKYKVKFDSTNTYDDLILQIFNNENISIEGLDLEDPNILHIVGKYYEKVKLDNEEAKKYYYKGFEKGDANLINDLANIFSNEKNYDQAKFYWQMAIDYGNIVSCRKLALHYKNVEENQEEAIKYFKLAIERGCYDSMLILSIYYAEIDFEKYKDEIEKLNIMCMDKHNIHSMFNLGIFNEKIKNYELAEKFYKIGAEHGNEKCMLNLAIYYKNKIKDIDLYLKYAIMSVESGSSKAMYNLGCYYNSIKDYEQAKKYYLMSIKLNNSDSMIELGKYYLNGNEQDMEQAKKYFLMAIETNNVGHYHMGMFYRKYQIDYTESKKYFEQGVENDCLKCIYKLGVIYNEESNKSEAKKYFMLGAEKGCPECAYKVAMNFSDDVQFSKKYLKIAIKNGSTVAFHPLALSYLYRDNNLEQAEKYLILGAESNDIKCLESLLKIYTKIKNYTNEDILKKLKKMKPSKIILNQIQVIEEQYGIVPDNE